MAELEDQLTKLWWLPNWKNFFSKIYSLLDAGSVRYKFTFGTCPLPSRPITI